MPRNSSGTYTLPAGNPVASNTIIETAWGNPTMSDLGSALTDSLSRGGSGSMLSALKIVDGAESAPGMSFNAEASTGLFRPVSKSLAVSIMGVEVARFTDTGLSLPKGLTGDISFAGTLKLADGTSAAPSLSFVNSPTMGLYRSAANVLGIISTRTLINETTDDTTTPLQIRGRTRIREGVLPSVPAANANFDSLVIECPGTAGISILTTKTTGAGIAWGDEDNANIGSIVYAHTNDLMTFTTGAVVSLVLADTYVRAVKQMVASDGDAAAPGYSFFSGTTTGLFRPAANTLGFAAGGTELARMWAGGLQLTMGNANLYHGDTNSQLNIIAAPQLVDATARIELYDTAHATLPRQIYIRGKQIVFTDSSLANEKARFTSATTQGELLINGTNVSGLSFANRGLLTVDGSAGAVIGMLFGGARSGYLHAISATDFRISSGSLTTALTLALNGGEVVRVDTDATFQYTAPTIGQFEVGFRGLPVQPKSAAYTMRLADRGCCIVQTAVGNIVTAAIFVAGDVVSISNKASGNIGLIATGITLNWGTGTPATGNRTLAVNALVTLYFTAANVATLTGTGIS